ncbi:MAG: amidohydrolase, partial [Gillisia sp.]
MKLKLLPLLLFFAGISLQAQKYFPTNAGVKAAENTNYTVFKNAKIHTDPSTVIENGMFAIQDGKITAVGKSIDIPKNSVVIDLQGKEVYPSFIDLFSEFGIKKPERAKSNGQPQYEASREGYYWNDHIRPSTNAVKFFNYDKAAASEYQKNGFGVVNTHMPDGIIRGTGMLVALNTEGTNGDRILNDRSAQYYSFDKSVQSQQSYPTSIMGVMALIRQVYMDAQWYAGGNSNTKDLSLEAINRNKNLVQIFRTDNLLNSLRADKVGDEIGMQFVILGSGNEFERLDEVKNTNATFIVPLDFPDAYDVEDPFLTNYISLHDMKVWNEAPANLKMMADKNIPFTLTTYSLKDPKKFHTNLLKAIDYGLDESKALAA